jgi:phosphate starvation-inducible PhoH-like protein
MNLNGRTKDTNWRDLRDNCLEDMIAEKQERRKIKAKTEGQADYLHAIRTKLITLCTGPAGTGKTYIPCGLAAQMLQDGHTERIILTRPLIPCSGKTQKDRVGYLPGDLIAKVGPFMRPMLDVLWEFYDGQELGKLIQHDIIQFVPLDHMRGLSIKNTIIIADEMQNADEEQWLMLLTRIGQGSKLVASGDASQSDVYRDEYNSLLLAMDRLEGDPDVDVVELTEEDIVRHGVIRRILERWRRG